MKHYVDPELKIFHFDDRNVICRASGITVLDPATGKTIDTQPIEENNDENFWAG